MFREAHRIAGCAGRETAVSDRVVAVQVSEELCAARAKRSQCRNVCNTKLQVQQAPLTTSTPLCRSRTSVTSLVSDAALEFDRFVRALGLPPNDPDERKNAGDGCVCSYCRDGFHGAKACSPQAVPSSAKGHCMRWNGYRLSHQPSHSCEQSTNVRAPAVGAARVSLMLALEGRVGV